MIRTIGKAGQGLLVAAVVLFLAPAEPSWSQEHRHHVAAGYGYARHGSRDSDFIGIDYVYLFPSGFTLGGYFEDVRGSFNIQAIGVEFGRKYANGLKFSLGPGVETKLKDDSNLLLFRVRGGYDWHRERWSFGPFVSFDFIEDATDTWYLGFAVGYGF